MQLIIELNELNFNYAKEYFDNLKLSTIKNINQKLIKTVSEKNYELLNMDTMALIHTGCTAEDHGIFRLGDVVKTKKVQIFEELEQNKFKVGSISAMNTINNLKNPSYFIPDPWTDPNSDNSFFSKIITSVLRDSVNNNSSGNLKKKNYFNLILIFLKFVRIKKYPIFIKLFFTSFFENGEGFI